jgi:phage antirepressor YoqD-like protein
MVMSESYAVQAKVYDRMVELEKELNKVEFYLPKTFAEALRLAADTEERNIALQQNVVLLENKVEIQKPAVEFVESYVEKGFNVCLSDGWKSLGMKPNLFTKQLLGDGILFRRGKSKNVLAKQCHINSGYFCERITEFGTQTLITPKGLLYISQKYRINPSASILDMMH